ncbi:MAG: RND transporter [Marinilabiliales bacterium]|nr:MAG: RND transporter [Marinilabiliales bacterium]
MKSTTLFILIFTMCHIPVLYSQDAKEISEKSLELTRVDAMEMISTLTIMDAKGNERVRQTTTASKKFGETTKIITKFISPADVKGTGLLVYDHKNQDDDMWIYLPALRKTRRIVSSEKGKSFMGSEFSNADMSAPKLDDYNYKILGETIYEDKNCWQIEATSVNDQVADDLGFSKKVSYVDKAGYFTYKNIFYDFDDEIFKEILLRDYEEIDDGKYMVRQMEAINLQNDRKSVMTIDKLQKGSDLTENSFTPAALEK